MILVAFGADAKIKRYYGNRGERCSTLCPKARQAAQADCEDHGKKASIKHCECNETAKRPYARIIYSCR